MNWRQWLDYQNISSHDRFFVCGGNPDSNGGGIIASYMNREAATETQRQAIMFGFNDVRILTWHEMMSERDYEG